MGIGGQYSLHSVQFRLISRILGVFILSQLLFANSQPSPFGVRVNSSDPLQLCKEAENERYTLTWIHRQEEYKEYESLIKDMLVFTKDKTLKEIRNCILLLVKRIFSATGNQWIQKMFS